MITPIRPGTKKFALRKLGLKSTRGRTSMRWVAVPETAAPIAVAALNAGCATSESEPSISA